MVENILWFRFLDILWFRVSGMGLVVDDLEFRAEPKARHLQDTNHTIVNTYLSLSIHKSIYIYNTYTHRCMHTIYLSIHLSIHGITIYCYVTALL